MMRYMELDVGPPNWERWKVSWSWEMRGVVGRREGAVTYGFLSLLLEMHEEDRAERKQRRSREGKLAGP